MRGVRVTVLVAVTASSCSFNRMDSPPQNLSFSDAFALQKSGNFQAAIDSYGAIVATTPGNASAWNNLGNCLRSIGRFEDSAVCLRRALSLNPSRANYRLNLSLTLLSLGDYASAWSEYEARLELIGHGADIRAAAPGWRGEALSASETLLIYGNQGLGDEMQCLRYLPRVLDLAPHVVLEVQAPLRSLANGFSGPASVIARGEPRPCFHRQVEWFSLPGIFRTTRDSVPPPLVPRFEPDPAVVAEISRLRSLIPKHRHIGLVWSGSPHNDLNPFRACGLEHMRPLLDLPDCRFYSLQLGPPRVDLERFESSQITDLAPWLTDLQSTATAITALDLVITTDTSVPHLAGTIGAETWLLLHDPADWRWQLERDHSPWYPSLKLFHQTRPRHWPGVIAEVRRSLESFATPV